MGDLERPVTEMKLTFDLERLTFAGQVYVGLAIFAACCALATVFRLGAFIKLGAVCYAVLFLVHPVFPSYLTPTDREWTMMRVAMLIVIALTLVTTFDIP